MVHADDDFFALKIGFTELKLLASDGSVYKFYKFKSFNKWKPACKCWFRLSWIRILPKLSEVTKATFNTPIPLADDTGLTDWAHPASALPRSANM